MRRGVGSLAVGRMTRGGASWVVRGGGLAGERQCAVRVVLCVCRELQEFYYSQFGFKKCRSLTSIFVRTASHYSG
jgi:hypothetical protein